ncbi:Transcription initiation factor TFIID subunit 13 [Lecanosticta acicola]|uniref:Transcription initiation factor TFIID subunit 13 n=1 Tax=Lecanosticta acicola TaxID=111012 RepID=A0AAI9EB51_9PEZI|nr:Transcription initiation factor TFIID subunit 13 [Lecanosticta acicola]
MTEPRARHRRQNAAIFPPKDLLELLYSFGDSPQPLNTTIQTLDEILTDFIIETCHGAALCASYSRRQKIKVDDFRWVLRHNPSMLGRVGEQLFREKWLKSQRKAMDFADYEKEARVGQLEDLVDAAGVEVEKESGTTKGKGRGKKRKAKDEGRDGGTKKPAV